MNQQQKNITKTVVIIAFIMTAFLGMFLHKITTPRYLSNIELKVKEPVSSDKLLDKKQPDDWLLLIDENNKEFVAALKDSLKPKLKNKLTIINKENLSASTVKGLKLKENTLALFDEEGRYKGYLRSPFDINKMKLTLSSVLTHR